MKARFSRAIAVILFLHALIPSVSLGALLAPLSDGKSPIDQIARKDAGIALRARAISQQIDQWLSPITIPNNVRIASAIESVKKPLGFLPTTNSIYLAKLDEIVPSGRDIAVAHEYGHAIFRANIGGTPHFKDDIDLSLRIRDRTFQRDRAKASSQNRNNPEEWYRSSMEFFDLIDASFDVPFIMRDEVKLPYEELFADIIAVLYSDTGGEALPRLLDWKQKTADDWRRDYAASSLPADYRGRDFTYPARIEGWRSDRPVYPDQSALDGMAFKVDCYNILDPLRNYLWVHYMKDLPKKQYGIFLEAYLEATKKDLEIVMNQGGSDSVEEKNRRMVNWIDMKMKERGIKKMTFRMSSCQHILTQKK